MCVLSNSIALYLHKICSNPNTAALREFSLLDKMWANSGKEVTQRRVCTYSTLPIRIPTYVQCTSCISIPSSLSFSCSTLLIRIPTFSVFSKPLSPAFSPSLAQLSNQDSYMQCFFFFFLSRFHFHFAHCCCVAIFFSAFAVYLLVYLLSISFK